MQTLFPFLATVPQTIGGWIDVVFLIFLVYMIAIGLLRGASHDIATTCGIIASLFLFRFLYGLIAPYVNPDVVSQHLAGIAVAVVLTILIARLFIVLLKRFLKIVFVGPLDTILGLLLRLVIYAILCILILAPFRLFPGQALQETLFQDSMVGKQCAPVIDSLLPPR